MADRTAEQLSALMDCECEERELDLALRRLIKDPGLKARWQRYHLIGDALKNNLPEVIDIRLAERIRAVIGAEDLAQTSAAATVSPWYRRATGFAAAASLALVMAAFAVKQPGGPDPAPIAVVANPAIPAPVATVEPLASDRALEARLSSYLVNHNEYASMNSVHGMLSYVRMVGYQPGR